MINPFEIAAKASINSAPEVKETAEKFLKFALSETMARQANTYEPIMTICVPRELDSREQLSAGYDSTAALFNIEKRELPLERNADSVYDKLAAKNREKGSATALVSDWPDRMVPDFYDDGDVVGLGNSFNTKVYASSPINVGDYYWQNELNQIDADWRGDIKNSNISRNETVAARDFSEAYGANVTWLGNESFLGNTYANAIIEYNGKTLNIKGNIVNDKLMFDPSTLNNYFGWHILNDNDIDAGIMSVNANGNYYKDVSVPLNAALAPVVKEAEEHARQRNLTTLPTLPAMPGVNITLYSASLLWFYEKVKTNAPWDIKVPDKWDATIAVGTYPGFGEKVYYNGRFMTPEQLGNYTFGYIGAALGLSLSLLDVGSFAAAGFPIKGAGLKDELYNDWPIIKAGFDAYNKDKQ